MDEDAPEHHVKCQEGERVRWWWWYRLTVVYASVLATSVSPCVPPVWNVRLPGESGGTFGLKIGEIAGRKASCLGE